MPEYSEPVISKVVVHMSDGSTIEQEPLKFIGQEDQDRAIQNAKEAIRLARKQKKEGRHS